MTTHEKGTFGLAALVVLLSLGASSSAHGPEPENQAEALGKGGDSSLSGDPLAAAGHPVTSGAAPGYVEDRLCESCHTDLYQSYQRVSMAQAFHKPRPERVIEDFETGSFFHEASRRHYQMAFRDGRYVFRRFQLDGRNEMVNVFEEEVDWVLGSGSHARVYLYQTTEGELYQLPIAWYGQTSSWGMAPGYERANHEGVGRLVRRECMFCHNAFPEVPAGSDAYDAAHTFPRELPEGLGCQRCHGPGAEHARIGMGYPVDFEKLVAAIVNPGDNSPERRAEVCYSCHMQPAVAVDSIRRFGRADYSFHPDERLAEYLVQIEVEEKGKDRADRFEINHHPYRLEQSRCFQESKGALSCLTCHDPHRKIEPESRATHYRAACLTCHQLEDCAVEGMEAFADNTGPHDELLPSVGGGDCVSCHMATRRPEDAPQVFMTDHLIRRHPLEGVQEQLRHEQPAITDVTLPNGPAGGLGEVYRATAAVRAGGGPLAIEWLKDALAGVQLDELDPYLDLARAQLESNQPSAAEHTLQVILAADPTHPWALEWKAIARSSLGEPAEALVILREAVARYPHQPRLRVSLGRLLTGLGRAKEAVGELEEAVRLRPIMVSAYFHLGHALAELGRRDDALRRFWNALEIEPSHTDAWMALARLLREKGDSDGADELLATARHLSARPEELP